MSRRSGFEVSVGRSGAWFQPCEDGDGTGAIGIAARRCAACEAIWAIRGGPNDSLQL